MFSGSQIGQSAAGPYILTAAMWFVLVNVGSLALFGAYLALSVREGQKAASAK
jgi:hypothetical protein